jgi:hypothetical protein
MWKRFIRWLKRLFSSDSKQSDETMTTKEKTSDKLDVFSCEVVSIEFEDDHQPERLKNARFGQSED